MDISARELARILDSKKTGEGWMGHCPAHDDKTLSLSTSEARDGKTLFHCFAGCTQESVLISLKGRGLMGSKGNG